MRNFFVNYRGGASSRAGLAYVGMCKQPGTSAPPRDINFQFNINQGYVLEFGDQYMRIKSAGAYITESNKNITGITQANPAVFTITSHGYSVGDWLFIQNVGGMTNFNGLTWIVHSTPTGNTLTLTDLFGNVVSSVGYPAYTSGGTAARIYTVVSPYAAVDLEYLKFTQSKDTMTLCCVNQATGTEYKSYELVRNSNTSWAFTADDFSAAIAAPSGIASAANASTTVDTWYGYVVTAVSSDGSESIASTPTQVENNNIAIYAGSNLITWFREDGAKQYRVYKTTPSYMQGVPVGVNYGFIGRTFGTSFTDGNITADFTSTPPLHTNPFARGAIASIDPTSGGSGYTQAGITYAITTSTGSGFVGTPVVVNGEFVAFIIENPGENYALTDTITITADGTGATADLVVGPLSGTYPGVPAYYQQRRVYANTLNQPDTYFMSRPGLYLNMDTSIPTIDSDAITGTPWAQQINGIQFMIPMTQQLVVLTGLGAWSLSGGAAVAITPSDQNAQSQAYNGCHNRIPPIVVNYDILYVQSKGSIVRDLAFNFYVNIFTGTDITILSNQLFNDHQLIQWAYAEEPYKIIWAVRDDGKLLSLTYLKEQEIAGWARHDTNGLFKGVCSVIEPPTNGQSTYVDAVYFIVKRYVQGAWRYYSERMDNRLWGNVEQAWCVDSGLAYPMTYPAATLTASAADGTHSIDSINLIDGGNGYTSPTITAIDPTGTGTGAVFRPVLINGVITSITILSTGTGYAQGTYLQASDLTGNGFTAMAIITNDVTFTASTSVFNAGMVGDIIRTGGGKATITEYVSGTVVIANITQAITATVPNDPSNMPIPISSGLWTISTPTTIITGLNHLNGLTVAILADGSVVPDQVVTNNSITLSIAASQITIGLPFLPQLQTPYLDVPQPDGTVQGKRKNVFAATVRMEASRGMSVGCNQLDASTQPDSVDVPWVDMKPFKERTALVYAGSAIPLFTGDEYILVTGEWSERGQVAVQQSYPLPANVLAVVTWFVTGDTGG